MSVLLVSVLSVIWTTAYCFNLHMKATEARHPAVIAVFNPDKPSFFTKKPFNQPVSWSEVFAHEMVKMHWDYPDVDVACISYDDFVKKNKDDRDSLNADICILLGFEDMSSLEPLTESSLVKNALAVIPKECSEPVHVSLLRFGSFDPYSFFEPLLKLYDSSILGKNGHRAALRQTYEIGNEVWERQSTDDLLFALQCYLDALTDRNLPSVRAVTTTEKTGFEEVKCMCTNCAKELADCFADSTCRKALNCLNTCKGNDQVCSYRCITSYETPVFEKFALCILQKNNCMRNSAEIPILPDPIAMKTFRGKAITHEIAQGICQGWLSIPDSSRASDRGKQLNLIGAKADKAWSWKVVCGQNPAYDYFGCQHQIFYPKTGVKGMWYDPVFKVETLAGEDVWRRRHYSVRVKKDEPGKFYFRVLDNGVISNEYWRILDCDDNLEWVVLYYSGAASAAGTNYRGALLCTPDGNWPKHDNLACPKLARIERAFKKGGVQLWELFPVSNKDCSPDCRAGPAPLGVPKDL